MSTRIFLSYSRRDHDLVARLADCLTRRGLKPWLDDQAMENGLVAEQISRGLESCDVFCVLALSPHYAESPWTAMEWSAALSLLAKSARPRVVVVASDPGHIPAALSGFLHINTGSLAPDEVATRIAAACGGEAVVRWEDWKALLDLIEADQFREDSRSVGYGGWSKSYYRHYIPLAFGNRRPVSVSEMDSISVTHWVVRGLFSLSRILRQMPGSAVELHRTELLLESAKHYLLSHFDGRGAGLVRHSLVGEEVVPDVRHSACFAKAMLCYAEADLEKVRSAIRFSLEHLGDRGYNWVPSYAECYHLIGLLRAEPSLAPRGIAAKTIARREKEIEQKLVGMVRTMRTRGRDLRLFANEGQSHMGPFYSWWVLDACGDLLLESGREEVRALARDVLDSLLALAVEEEEGGWGFALTLSGPSEPGMTAATGELLMRLRPCECEVWVREIRQYLVSHARPQGWQVGVHREFLWAIPPFFERYDEYERAAISALTT